MSPDLRTAPVAPAKPLAAVLAPKAAPPSRPARPPTSAVRRLLADPFGELREIASLDQRFEKPLPGAQLRVRSSRIKLLRRAVQVAFLLTVLWIGAIFVRWVDGLEAGRIVGERPPGVEGFLPIAALLSLRHFVETGVATRIHPAGLVIFVLALALGVLLKKAFCSWICPVGAVSEWLANVSRRIFGRKLRLPRWLDVPLRSLKYLLLAFFANVILLRMSAADVGAFLEAPYSRVADIKMLRFFQHLSSTAAIVVAALVALSIVVPYFWCRYLCPYGGLLGVLSLLSPLKVTRHAPSCIDCGLCARACPSHLPVDRLSRVRSDECVGCLSCVAACPVPRALRVETPRPWRRAVRPAAFAALVVALFAGGILAAKIGGYWRTSITNEEYMARIQELDGPQYTHVQGTTPK